MNIALELLEFLNFDFRDEKAFKKIVAEKELVKGVPFPYDTYTRLMALAQAPFNRTSQLVKEWLTMRCGSCDFQDEGGIHVYTASVPDKQPGSFRARVKKGSVPDCYVVRGAEWRPNEFTDAHLGGKPVHSSLEALLAKVHYWADVRMPLDELEEEVKHYFKGLTLTSSSLYEGYVGFRNRLVEVRLKVKAICNDVELSLDMQNHR